LLPAPAPAHAAVHSTAHAPDVTPGEAPADALRARFDQIRAELGVPVAFGDEVLTEAKLAAAAGANPSTQPLADLTGIDFVTVDPKGATDLDQAMYLERRDDGYRVEYAIADVPGFVQPGGAVDAEARRRGQTIYAPDRRTPLHPPVLSEAAASLLPGQDRPAFVWRFDLDDAGQVRQLDLVRARIRSRQQLDYEQVQAAADEPGRPQNAALAGLAQLLREVGERRQALELARGGASLPLPEQEVHQDGDSFTLTLRRNLPAEDWNAQLSLMTGIAAAGLMLSAGTGVLRTMPPPDPVSLRRFRAQTRLAGVPWPEAEPYGAFLRRLDSRDPAQLALLHAAGALFRGAGYTPFDGSAPAAPGHAAVASEYAHVTAPLRRLVDRFGLLCAYCAHQGTPVPDWVRAALPQLPQAMMASDRLAGEVERRCLDAVEVALLAGRGGQTFDAVVVAADRDGAGGRVQLVEPPVLAHCGGVLTPGAQVTVVLEPIAPGGATVQFHVT
jgi:exoribonuclease R